MKVKKQHIYTPPLGTIIKFLMDKQKNDERILSVSPHYSTTGRLYGYLVITEDQ